MSKNSGIVALNSTEATITTATITIKALKVNDRQLTQAVFRQLPERELIDESKPEIIGLPWGWVNYQSADMSRGRQFVAQFGETLARCPVEIRRSQAFLSPNAYHPEGYRSLFNTYKGLLNTYVLIQALNGNLLVEAVKNEWVYHGSRGGLPNLYIKFSDFLDYNERAVIRSAIDPRPAYRRTDAGGSAEIPRREIIDAAREKLRDLLVEWGVNPDTPPAEVGADLDALDNSAAAFRRRWDNIIDTLECVEQLFIAT